MKLSLDEEKIENQFNFDTKTSDINQLIKDQFVQFDTKSENLQDNFFKTKEYYY